MKVILSEDVDNVGAMGATVSVADGFARNFLIPRRLAVQADSASAKQVEHEMGIIRRKEERRKAEFGRLAKDIEKVTIEIQMRAGEEEKLFGSVTTGMIAEQLEEKGYAVDRKKISLAEPIKSLGIFMVPVKLGCGVEATVKVWVSAIQDAVAESTEAAPEQN